jgi:hypothetical protein
MMERSRSIGAVASALRWRPSWNRRRLARVGLCGAARHSGLVTGADTRRGLAGIRESSDQNNNSGSRSQEAKHHAVLNPLQYGEFAEPHQSTAREQGLRITVEPAFTC